MTDTNLFVPVQAGGRGSDGSAGSGPLSAHLQAQDRVRTVPLITGPSRAETRDLVIDRLTVQRRVDSMRASLVELETQAQELLRMLDSVATISERPPENTDLGRVDRFEAEYLSIRELAHRIPYAEQTIRNLMTRGVFRLGEHYIKPRSRIMFRWSEVRRWLEQEADVS